MANFLQGVYLSNFDAILGVLQSNDTAREIYDENKDRIYTLAFWMTDNELAAEQLVEATFVQFFAEQDQNRMNLDDTLMAVLRECMSIGMLTLDCDPASEVKSIRQNTKRVHLERAIVQLPATERLIFVMHDGEGYSHGQIANTIGITEQQCRSGLHQARLRIRELVSEMN